jgi:glycosyltransferase involved in cell wall biosynthesis
MVRDYRAQADRLRLLPKYRAVAVASRHMADEFRRHGVPADRLHVVPPPAPPEPAADPDPPADRPMTGELLVMARLAGSKGVRHAVAALGPAARRLGRPLRLTVTGDGPDRGRLEALARRLGADVRFAGWVSPDERDRLIRAADLLVVPSTWPEPFGLVGLEAGCAGVPAVAFAVGGVTDWLTPGVSGELAPADPPTADGLADSIVRALRSAEHWSALRRGAWESARRFTLGAYLDGVEKVLRAAVGPPP